VSAAGWCDERPPYESKRSAPRSFLTSYVRGRRLCCGRKPDCEAKEAAPTDQRGSGAHERAAARQRAGSQAGRAPSLVADRRNSASSAFRPVAEVSAHAALDPAQTQRLKPPAIRCCVARFASVSATALRTSGPDESRSSRATPNSRPGLRGKRGSRVRVIGAPSSAARCIWPTTRRGRGVKCSPIGPPLGPP